MKITEILEAVDRPMPKTDLRVGDHVVADTSKEQYPGGHKSRSGVVTRIGQTGVHIQPDDGGEREYHPYKIVKKSEGQVSESDDIQLQDKKIYTFLRAVVNWWNDKNPTNRISYHGPGMRVWTRGDGTRSRDPAKLTQYPDAKDSIDMLWVTLSKIPGVKPAGTVSHEFPSIGSNDAITFKGFILVKRNRTIDVMTPSRVKNPNSVWKQKQAEVAEAATAGATSSGSIATVVNPGMTNKNPAAGSPGKMAKKGPPQWMPKKQTPKDNALDKNVGLMTGTPIRR